MNNVIAMLCVLHVIAFSQSKPLPPSNHTVPDVQQSLREQIDRSLHIWDNYPIYGMSPLEKEREEGVLRAMDSLIRLGAEVGEHELQLLFVRDGGGWSSATSPRVLKRLLDGYYGKDKADVVSRLLLEAIPISDPGIAELLISGGARPSHRDIRQCLMGITPDYCPSYETLRLLVEKSGFALYEQCNITLSWWLVYERATVPARRDSRVLGAEFQQRMDEADLVCNQAQDGGIHFLDPDIFPAGMNAWELAAAYGDEAVLAYRRQRCRPRAVYLKKVYLLRTTTPKT